MHDIRQGLRSFSTNYYLAPGRLNEVDVEGRTVIIDSTPRWSALMLVTTEMSLYATPTPRRKIPPRAVSVTANSTTGWRSPRPAPPGKIACLY
ncbi:MAG TPA: hypothetical protein VJ820_04345 [Propionibacteriaceae bacterium]|nr:hypothetical protein [Propionibacteriaceae bacterium]